MSEIKLMYLCEICGESEYLEGDHTIICICGHIQSIPDDEIIFDSV
ncbi:hypothetical protein PAQU9191_01710 [Photobacterium aquimaris]|uniref:Uncharacterized protein n=1 Tax=Photobacterium aquimaris TaxID=512643 RepID=A0A1Y6KWC5_9GAMM|nr:hypothetical protein PAQU9191_01710 [Photobacterium aquimaris]